MGIKDTIKSVCSKAKNTVEFRAMMTDIVADGVLDDEEKAAIISKGAELGMTEQEVLDIVMPKVNERRNVLDKMAEIEAKIESIQLLDNNQVGTEDYDALIALAAEIDEDEKYVETKLMKLFGTSCLKVAKLSLLTEKIAEASATGKVGDLNLLKIRSFASGYEYTDAELFAIFAEELKKAEQA